MFGQAGSLTSLEEMLKAEFLLRGMELCGYQAASLGEKDVRFGEAFLTEHLGEVDLQSTSANLSFADDDQPYALRYAVWPFEEVEVTVGVVGLIDEAHRSAVEEASAVDGAPLTVANPAAAFASAVEAMGETDLVVVLADASAANALELAADLEGADVVLASHERANPMAPERVGGAWVGSTGYDGKWMIRLDYRHEADGSGSVVGWHTVALDSSWPDDPELAALYDEYLDRLASEAENIVDSIPQETPEGGSYVGSGQCQSCHDEQTSSWVSTEHSTAFTTLVLTHHDWDPSCFPCHTTGFGYVGGFLLPDRTPETKHVGCEMCHGAGAEHVADPEQQPTTQSPLTACVGCHTAEHSPEFNIATYLPQVQH